jgi:2'-hydroxyisoflavone reductase
MRNAMTSRRRVLQLGAYLAASGVLPRAIAAAAQPKTLLILGGTGFIGPHLTQVALRLGWKVTHFNRGKRAPDGVADVETLIGDRNGQIDALRGRKWDVVIDDTGQIPKYVKMSAELLAPNVGYCPRAFQRTRALPNRMTRVRRWANSQIRISTRRLMKPTVR